MLCGQATGRKLGALLPYEKRLLEAVTDGGQRATLKSLTARMPDVLDSVRQSIGHDAVSHGWLHRFRHDQRTEAGDQMALRIGASSAICASRHWPGPGCERPAARRPALRHDPRRSAASGQVPAQLGGGVRGLPGGTSHLRHGPASANQTQSQSPALTSRSWTSTSVRCSGSPASNQATQQGTDPGTGRYADARVAANECVSNGAF